MKTVFIADDEDSVRLVLDRLVSCLPDCRTVGQAGSLPATLDGCRQTRPDFVLLDLRMPGAAEAGTSVAAVRAASPRSLVLAISGSHDLEGSALAAGAAAFIRKPFRLAEVELALLGVVG